MALQGTLDTFALPDVLRLLASTKKTGRLVITGTRGSGSVWVDTGAVVGAEASGAGGKTDWVGVLFELLRFDGDGSFTFEAGTTASQPSPARPVEPLLVDAERQLAEWREIEAVVPSLETWVSLVSDLGAEELTVTAERWKRIVAIGSGTTVANVARTLDLGELDVCRSIKELVELGLVDVGAGTVSTSRIVETMPAPAAPTTPATPGSGASWDPFSIEIPGVAPLTPTGADETATDVREETSPVADPVNEETVRVLSVVDDIADDESDDTVEASADEGDADEMAKQLASLSPKAARAVAAAAKATSEQERDAALAEASDDDDEPINRGLLLKFLSSVKS